MATSRVKPGSRASGKGGAQAPVCLVTEWTRLANRFSEVFGRDRMLIRHRLADVIGQDCGSIVVDTKVEDIGGWPAPLLLEPDARSKSWLFLLSDPRDIAYLEAPPPNCALFPRSVEAVDAIASHLNKRLDPASGKRIENVAYLDGVRTFIVRLENGRSYALHIHDLSEADVSRPTRWRIGPDRRHFTVTQESGKSFEVPWDVVLYHCEPEYEYFKGTLAETGSADRAVRIGSRVRELRLRAGLSVTDLAQRAGLKRPNLSRLESGRHLPSLDTLQHVADALGVPVARLVSLEEVERQLQLDGRL